MAKKKKETDLDDPFVRIGLAKGNLLKGTIASLISNFAMDPKHKYPKINDMYLDDMVTETPQRIKDYQNQQIDKSTRGVVQSVLSTTPINKAANIVAVADANAVEAKANLAANQDLRDIGLKNNYLAAKQRRIDTFEAMKTDAENRMIQNQNTKIGNTGAIATNYFNELQRSMANEFAIQDRKNMTTQGYNQFMQSMPLIGQYLGKTGLETRGSTPAGGVQVGVAPAPVGAPGSPIRHGARQVLPSGDTVVYDSQSGQWVPDAEWMKKNWKKDPNTGMWDPLSQPPR